MVVSIIPQSLLTLDSQSLQPSIGHQMHRANFFVCSCTLGLARKLLRHQLCRSTLARHAMAAEAACTLFDRGARLQEARTLSATQYTKGAVADIAFNDAVRDIMLSRRPMSDYDQVVKDWARDAGDQIRKEYTVSIAAAR